MSVGPSTSITKAVVEVFSSRFLRQPAVLFVSESGNKIVARDDQLARRIGCVCLKYLEIWRPLRRHAFPTQEPKPATAAAARPPGQTYRAHRPPRSAPSPG